MKFNETECLSHLKHYLPTQAPLKDFIHHNTLHAFQELYFKDALKKASLTFGYRTYLSINEYRELYLNGKINNEILNRVIREIKKGEDNVAWKIKLLQFEFDECITSSISKIREVWKSSYQFNLNKITQPALFRITNSYLDQGIAMWKFPVNNKGFLESLKNIEKESGIKIFTSKRVKNLFYNNADINKLLEIIVGNEKYFEAYLFAQQFAHPGWSGMVAVLEENPGLLYDKRQISLREFIILELLLEINTLDEKYGENKWQPIGDKLIYLPSDVFEPQDTNNEIFDIYYIWQQAYEWTYYENVLKGLSKNPQKPETKKKSFAAILCIDDRECSFRRYLEELDSDCVTFGTAGFFNVPFYFQPEHGKFYTKLCPAPLTPKHIIKETHAKKLHKKEAHFNKHSQSVLGGWIISQSIGFWSAIKLALNIFYPRETPFMVSSFKHMDRNGKLKIENTKKETQHENLHHGFTKEEMAERVEGLLKGIGLIKNFPGVIYIIGHGASSVNNTHYAGYDCGACSGRAGSVNARVAAYMANHSNVRELLSAKGINIPVNTCFIGALHDTTRDEIEFYDEEKLSKEIYEIHKKNKLIFEKALDKNAKERSRRFILINSKQDAKKVHEKVKLRALSLFEPRPEWNHATNALCIVGNRDNNKHLFLDRRSFLNSYDYRIDPDGKILLNILNAVSPVCGGINLEYYFSRVDNLRLGAGTKLPHNVMGLIGVANGIDGDLRPGLPLQMINIHDPLRLLVIVEHTPDVVLKTIKQNPAAYEWFKNQWVHLAVIHPENKKIYVLKEELFHEHVLICSDPGCEKNIEKIIEANHENLPVYNLVRNEH